MKNTAAQSHAMPASAAVFGASGGIGAAMVTQLEEQGCRAIYAGSRQGVAVGSAIPFAFDLSDEASIASAAEMMPVGVCRAISAGWVNL